MPRRCVIVERKDEQGNVIGHARVQYSTTTPQCEFCRKRLGTQQCDYPLGGTNEDGSKKTCDRFCCKACAGSKGNFDYCPDHRQRAGLPPKPKVELDLADARWLDEARYPGHCATPTCNHSIEEGERCLYLPRARKVLCETCGEGL